MLGGREEGQLAARRERGTAVNRVDSAGAAVAVARVPALVVAVAAALAGLSRQVGV